MTTILTASSTRASSLNEVLARKLRGCEMTRLIDLSVSTEASPSELIPVKVSHERHRLSVEVMKMFFGCA